MDIQHINQENFHSNKVARFTHSHSKSCWMKRVW